MSHQRYSGLDMSTSDSARDTGVMRVDDQQAHQAKAEAKANIVPTRETCEHGAQDNDGISLPGPSKNPASNQLSSETTLDSEDDYNANHHLQQYQSLPQDDSTAFLAGRRLVRFYFRTMVGILGPIIVLCYLTVIWQIFLAPVDTSSVQSFGPKGAQWVFYSWFIAGIIGLNLSLYGLAGVEAAMLMEPFWRTKDAMRLMLHADRTWSGPGGWIKTMKWAFQMRQAKPSQSINPGRLWFILAFPSVVVFIAWPLSGLCLEITNGFVRGSPDIATMVTGFVHSDFNSSPGGRSPSVDLSPDLQVPGYGAVYTPRGFDRSTKKYLQELPVTLPKNEAVEEIFLTAQSEDPIEGKAWGLLLHYDCRIVEKLSDMRLLNERKAAADTWSSDSSLESTAFSSYRIHDNTALVEARKIIKTGGIDGLGDEEDGKWALNTDAVLETAYETLVLSNNDPVEDPCGSSPDLPTAICYYATEDDTVQHKSGMQRERMFEVLLWQAFSSYAMKLMYNNKRDFVGVDGSRLEKLNPNVTAFVAGTVITRGVVSASIPIALFAIWALISAALCLIYGFRRRWSETLDGHTVFRLGVELKDKYRTELQKHSTLAEIEECSALREIPGIVSDMEPRSRLGRIGLIEGQTADKSKFYF